MDVQYIGRSDFRVIRTQDLAAQGISGWQTTEWARNETKAVQDEGGAWLVEHLADEFKEITGQQTAKATATTEDQAPTLAEAPTGQINDPQSVSGRASKSSGKSS